MKKAILFAFLLIISAQPIFAQNAIAKLKYEEAEEAFTAKDYETTLSKLNEVETLLKSTNPKILYLKICAQSKIIEAKNSDFALVENAKNLSIKYLKDYEDLADNEEKYREIYKISERLNSLYNIKSWENMPEFVAAGKARDNEQYAEAMNQYKAASEKGNGWADNEIGTMFRHGRGVSQSIPEAIIWYKQAGKRGDASGFMNLGYIYTDGEVPVNMTESLSWFRKAAEKGHEGANYLIGGYYERGEAGVTQSYTEAMNWYLKAANKGNADGLYAVAIMYKEGLGVSKNELDAVTWFKKAAEKKHPRAMRQLGVIYYYGGDGISKNYQEAINWYKKSVEIEKHGWALFKIGEMYSDGLGVQQSYTEAMLWLQKSAALGYKDAMNKIGSYYEQGLGVQRDKKIAQEWYSKAAAAK